ncbi:hypothetical protein N0V82_009589 [Gnomoniopsis sp. IMI 355080]|nr:hypothetical protein N0V82_009589 [Gnomoniopsis sp. IMI 355080]
MASQLTDDLILSHRLLKRRYVQIPKDQQAHLGDNAWSETLSRGQHPMLNVPASVLEDVKDLHTRKFAKFTQQASSAQRSATANLEEIEPKSSPQGSPTSSPQQDDDRETQWSTSPVQHLQIPSPSPKQPSLPRRSPLKRKTPPQFVNDEPQSSGVNSSGLEIELPGYVSQAMEPPVNRTALQVIATASAKLEPTPPSAQLPVVTGERAIKPPLANRKRITDAVHYSGSDSTPSEPAAAMRPSQKPNTSNHNSLNTTVTTIASSPSLSTQISRGRLSNLSGPKVVSDPAPYRSFTPTFEGRRQEKAAQHLVMTRTQTPGSSFAPTRAQRSTPAKVPSYTPKSSRHSLKHSQASLSTSFETFRLAYPDYSRSSRDFVTALLSVKQLRRDRALHEFLYDDFIRAYSSDYFAYVSECSRKQIDKILPGIQWYNENVQDVLYTQKIVRKNNLAAFLHFHANEAHSIRRALGDSQSTESAVEDSDEIMEDVLDGNEDDEPEDIELDRGAESQASPDVHIESPGPLTGSQLRDQPSLGIDEPTGTAHIAQDAEQVDEQMMVDHFNEYVQQPLVEAASSRPSPELHIESPSAAKVTAALTKHHAPARKSTTPTSVRSFASQEHDRDFLSPILNSSSRNHATMRTQISSVVSPPQRAAQLVASRGAHIVLAADEDSDDEDAFDPPMSSPTRPAAATPSLSKKAQAASAEQNGNGNDVLNSESPIPLPQRAAGSVSSTSRPREFSVGDEDDEDASAPSKLRAQQRPVLLSTSKLRTISAEEDQAESSEVPVSPLPRVVGPSSSSRSRVLAIKKEYGTDEDDNGALLPQPLRKPSQNVPAYRTTSRSSTAVARPMATSTMPAPKPSALVQSRVLGRQRSEAIVSKAPSIILGEGRRHSAGSSIASSTNAPRSKKRLSETSEQRSMRLKAFMEEQMEKKKRLSSGPPGSTSASRG